MIKIGFISTGGMARIQATAFSRIRGCRICSGADPSQEARDAMARHVPGIKMFEDYHALLADPKVDAVVVCPPTGLHKAITIDAMKAGKPVLLEKPMARTAADCRRMIEVSRQTGVLLMIAHCRRFDPIWGTWRKLLDAGRIGSPVLWRAVSASILRDWRLDDRMGGGPVLDASVHNFDYANWIWGDPLSVMASGINLDPTVSAVDTASAVVHYPGGNQLLVSLTWVQRGSRMFDILGPKGAILQGTGPLERPPGVSDRISFYCLLNSRGKPRLFPGPKDNRTMYVRQARHFLDCIAGKTKCIAPGEEAIKAVAVAEAILKAAPKCQTRKVVW